METIKIEEELNTSVTFSKETVSIMQGERDVVFLSYSEALSLATAIIEHCGEWVSVDVKPESGYYRTNHIDSAGTGTPITAYYSKTYNTWTTWLNDNKQIPVLPTHYQPIPQPKP